MAEYIERKALLNALKEERKKGNFVFTSKWIKEIMDDLPTADVVPKSEVKEAEAEIERLKHILDCYALQYGTVMDKYIVIEGARAEVAREIFEEIEDALFNNHCLDEWSDYPTPHYYEELKDDIAELKNKYTEGE